MPGSLNQLVLLLYVSGWQLEGCKALTLPFDTFAGRTELTDFPLSILEAIYRLADYETQTNLAQSLHVFRGFWKTLRICEGYVCSDWVTMTGRSLCWDRMVKGAEVLASRFSVGAHTADSDNYLMLGNTRYCISLNGHFGPRHLRYIMQQDLQDARCLGRRVMRILVQNMKAGFDDMFGNDERVASTVLLRFKLYHGRQEGLSDDELERLSIVFTSMPASFGNWCHEERLLSMVEPVWQIVSPAGSTLYAHWHGRHENVIIVDLP